MSAPNNEQSSRAALRKSRRIVVKAGTSIVANEDGRPSLARLGSLVEQISDLMHSGVEVIFVSSGAVGMGKSLLKKQSRRHMSFAELHRSGSEDLSETKRNSSFLNVLNAKGIPHSNTAKGMTYNSACAAAGQFEMMNLYSSLFNQYDINASQLLLTQEDFQDDGHLLNMSYSVERLLSVGILPIINENDAVSANSGYTDDDVFSDNDMLAALVARNFRADAIVLLTDVEGVFDRPPSEGDCKLHRFFTSESAVQIGEKSAQGRGGMLSKIKSAVFAVSEGSTCRACVIASGYDNLTIRSIFQPNYDQSFGLPRGTLFATPGSSLEKIAEKESVIEGATSQNISDEARERAISAREQARRLKDLPFTERKTILHAISDALINNKDEILAANKLDLAAAMKDGTEEPLVKRLKLTNEKIRTISEGIRQIANQKDPLGVVKSKRELAQGLELSQITVPIGVLMIIFESRPDSFPQISALALASGNGLLLKGGKEATQSNFILNKIIGDAIESGSNGKITRDIIALITTRGQVTDMLALDDVIDLVIPRGSNKLVSHIKKNTRIPVMGHADGVCHVYVDSSATAESASDIIIDSKTDYPSACNAMETLLLHGETLQNGVAMHIMMKIRAAGVKCLGGPKAMKSGLCDVVAEKFKHEYGNFTCMVEVVDNMDQAIEWIHKYGSGHTEAIICAEEDPVGEEFLKRVDSACVFKNASTRFSDGFRFGLGAEVGISTGRIHARGPVGVEGLLTTKWQIRSSGVNFVAEFGGDVPIKKYTHKDLM